MYHIIVNPASKSGKGKKIWEQLVPILESKNIAFTPYFTNGAGDACKYTANISANTNGNTAIIIVLGGDGTMNEVLQGMQDYEHTIVAYIPTGSSNDLARDLNISRNPMEALEHILNNPTITRMDVGMLTYESCEKDLPIKTRYFNVGAGIGFDAAVCEEALNSPIKNTLNRLGLGKLTYLGIALKQLIAAKSISCDITLDDKETIHLPTFLFAVSMVHRYEGGGFKFCPDASYTDGLLDICIAGPMSKLKLLRILPTAYSGKHLRFKNILSYRVEKISIQTSAPLWVQTDGEVETKADHITATCLKEKLQFIL
ncbi:MAG: diacylglycerol kinase family lipid kinase [Lachnospiraceae bacterium]|nr:diacylglycerol kinase family lipid kinase [Lachnospiraceae bacterium]